jgi:hypothetical protein
MKAKNEEKKEKRLLHANSDKPLAAARGKFFYALVQLGHQPKAPSCVEPAASPPPVHGTTHRHRPTAVPSPSSPRTHVKEPSPCTRTLPTIFPALSSPPPAPGLRLHQQRPMQMPPSRAI